MPNLKPPGGYERLYRRYLSHRCTVTPPASSPANKWGERDPGTPIEGVRCFATENSVRILKREEEGRREQWQIDFAPGQIIKPNYLVTSVTNKRGDLLVKKAVVVSAQRITSERYGVLLYSTGCEVQ